MRSWLPGRLRTRLALSHGLVVLAAIGLVLLLGVALLRRYETRVEMERLTSIVQPLALRTNIERLDDDRPGGGRNLRAARLDEQAAELRVRLLVLDASGAVVHDTQPDTILDSRASRRLERLAAALGPSPPGGQRRPVALPPRSGRSPFPGDIVIAATVRGSAAGDVLVLVSERERYPLLRPALGPLALITLASLAGAIVAGLALSRWIAGPIERLTAASDAMAAGSLDQRVAGEGRDEIGRLVSSFNTMSERVAATSRSQRDLVANVAHELRTPLTAIRGFSRAIVDGVIRTEDDRDRALATVDREAGRMSDLIAELLDLARLEAGAVSLTREPVALGPLLDEAVARFEEQARELGVALTAETELDPRALGDHARLLQVVTNLVANALAHTPPGGAVRVGGRAGDDAGRRDDVVVTVSDTGEGIASDRLDRVFDRFDRGDASERRGTGSGLGLAIVRELVELHGGRITIESAVGRGTTFTVTLPAAAGTAPTTAPPLPGHARRNPPGAG